MIDRPSNVVVGGEVSPGEAERSRENVSFVVVSLGGNAEATTEKIRTVAGTEPDAAHVVGPRVGGAEGYDSVYEVSGTDDLSGMSMKIGRCISDSRDSDLFLYFDSVSELLEGSETMTAYRFLNALTGRIRNADGIGYFEMSRAEYEPEVVGTFESLFDRFVDESGELRAAGD